METHNAAGHALCANCQRPYYQHDVEGDHLYCHKEVNVDDWWFPAAIAVAILESKESK